MIRGGNRLERKTARRLALLLMAGLTALEGLPHANHLMTTANQALLIKRRHWLQEKSYVHTLNKRVPPLFATLAEKSGGRVVKKRI